MIERSQNKQLKATPHKGFLILRADNRMIQRRQDMKSLRLKTLACALACAVLVTAAACGEKEEKALTQDSPSPAESEIVSEIEEPDVGLHKDYDKENAEAYESNGVLIVDCDGKKRGMEIFVSNESYAEFYGNELNTIKDRLDPRVNIYSMIVPTACEFYCPANKRGEIDSQKETAEYIKDILVNVKAVDVFQTLNNHNAEEIYFRTDNRWAPLGAYYAGKVFAKQAGVDYADISQYTKVEHPEYIGNLGNYVDSQGLLDFQSDPETFTYYKPKAKFVTHYYDEEFEYLTDGPFFEEVPDSMYETFFKGGYYCLKLSTDVKNGRKLIIVKDDYGTALAPFMTSSFEEVYVVDIEYLEANLVEMIEEFKITDVLYVMNTFSVTGDRSYLLENLRSQATHGTLKDDAPDDNAANEGSKGSDTAAESDEESSGVEYIYGVGVNNQIGVIENSQPDDNPNYDYGGYEDPAAGYDYGGYDEGDYDYGNDDGGYDYGDDYGYEE